MGWPVPSCVREFCRSVLPLLCRAANGRRVLESVGAILETDRWTSFDQYHRTARRLAQEYESAGAVVEVHPLATGGRIGSGRWVIQEAEDIRSATLDVVRPVERRLADYRANPWHVIAWSAATGREGITADLVIIDSADELDRLRPRALAGKIVLTCQDPRRKLRFDLLAAKGSAGVISDFPVPGHPDATKWMKFGFGGIELERTACRIVGLMIPERTGRFLRNLMRKRGRVTVHARVDVRRYVGTHDVVSGVVRGAGDPQSEVWAVAHSSEPGALDNASGVGVCVEIARLLETLIAGGAVRRPRRSIRLLSGHECFGAFGYLDNVYRYERPLAGVCIDSVGARPSVCDGRMQWNGTTPMTAGFIDRLGAALVRQTLRIVRPGYRLVRGPFVSTPETLIADPRYGFPCAYLATDQTLAHGQYKAYHSSADTASLLSVRGLKACAAAMAAYLYFLADAGSDELAQLATAEAAWALGQLRSRAKAPAGARADLVRVQHAVCIGHLKRWTWGGDRAEILSHLDGCERQVAERAVRAARRQRPARVPAAARRIAHRSAPLTPLLENTPPPLAKRISEAALPAWTLYWADGRRSLAEIAELTAAERGRTVSLAQVTGFFEAHADLGYVKLIRPGEVITRRRLVADLKALGLRTGMNVIVHSSLSKIGFVAGGPNTLIDALLEVIGKRGTLAMPSFNHRDAYVFNPLATRTKNGAVADAMWRRADAVRSVQATHPVAAIGPMAEALCHGHMETRVWGQDSPIGRLVHGGGYVVSIGVTQGASTAYHVAEDSIPAPCIEPFWRTDRIVMADGTVRRVRGLAYRNMPCPVSPAMMQARLERRRLIRHGKVGGAAAMLVKAHDVWRVHRELIRRLCAECRVRPAARLRRPMAWPAYLEDEG